MRRFVEHLPGRLPVAAILAVSVVIAGRLSAEEKPAAPASGADKAAAPVEMKPVSYHTDVLPILQASCQGCHQPAKASGKLDMTIFKGLLSAGESGAIAIVPGKPGDSAIVEQITPDKGEAAMPKGKPPLKSSEIELIRRWIEEGAKDDTPPDTTPPIDVVHPPVYNAPPVITSIDWSPNGELIAVAGFHEVLLQKADGSGLVARLVGMSERIDSVRFSPDGTKLAVTGGRSGRVGEVQIWDVAEHKLLVSVPVTTDDVFGASWSPDGKRVAFGCTDKTVRAIDAETGEQNLFMQIHDDWVLGTTFSNDGSHLVSIGRDMAAKLIDVGTQRFIDNVTSITPGALKGGIQSIKTHPLRDEIVFGGADGATHIYRMHRITARQIGDDANQLWDLPSQPGRIFGVDISRDGTIIAAGSSLDGHGTVNIYQMEATPKTPKEIEMIIAKPVTNRSDAETAKLHQYFEQGVKTLAKLEVAEGGVYAVALSPKGDRVAAAGGDGKVRIFDTKQGAPIASFVPVEISKSDAQAVASESSHPQWPAAPKLSGEPYQPASDSLVKLSVEPASIQLESLARYAQVIVTAEYASGAKVDVTREAKFEFSDAVAAANAVGIVTPAANGKGTLTVSLGDKSEKIDVAVSNLDHPHSPDFIRDVAPMIAKAGCNAGTCHGAQAGKNGFKLSLRGYDPIYDVRALTDDLASRRVNIASPMQSLMLLKPTASVPHTGGKVLMPGSVYYETLRQWIAGGAQLNLASSRITGIKVTPQNPVIETIGGRQQVRVVATYSDGSERDVTREAFVESGNTDVVKTVPDAPGLLESLRRGEAAALVRYEGKYAATTLTVMGDRAGFAWNDMPANNRVDELVAAKLKRTKTLPSAACNDYEFARRVYLDLTGLPPTPEQLQSFVDDQRDTRVKRDELIDKLVGNDDYIEFWTNKWADLLMVNRKYLGVEGATAFRNWIRAELAENRPYNEFVHEILTATGSNRKNPAASYFKSLRTPEALMENTTHLFLATRFNCNKCHDHPFERWTQDQYYHMAAFFAQVDRARDPASGREIIRGSAVDDNKPLYEIISDAKEGEVKHIRTGAVSPPAFPFECKHEEKQGETRREELAAWITSPDNPYFAKSYVNRLWGYLNGRGIIEPLDDIRAGNPATNPELLDYLTSEFIKSGFNTRHMMQLICKSRTYQLSVETNKWNADDQINFSHARARRLPAEVLYDAIYRATGATSSFAGVAPGTRAAMLPDVGVELADGFLGNLGRPARESACECERSSNLQLGPVMALVSGPTVGSAISDPDNAVAKLVGSVKDNHQVVKDLFLRFLNRPGNQEEVSAASQMFDELDAEHAKLAAELTAYGKELGPKVAQSEIERQNRVAALQTELEAYREIMRLRQPRVDQDRSDRIAKATAALAAYGKEIAPKMPEWEAAQNKRTKWYPAELLDLSATMGAKFTRQDDGSVFVETKKGKGSYHVVVPVPLGELTGIRLDALADDRLPNRGPGRGEDGNFVLTEFVARSIPASELANLVRSWDFAASENDWQAEDGAKVVADSGMRHLFGNGMGAGMKTSLKAPAGKYVLDIVTGIRPAVAITVEWTTTKNRMFDGTLAARRTLPAGEGGGLMRPIAIDAKSPLTGLRILVDDETSVLPIDAVRLFSAKAAEPVDLKLQQPEATFNQEGYNIASAIDGDSTTADSNGWAIAPAYGRDHSAKFELAKPISAARGSLLELTLHQNYVNKRLALGRFRIMVTDSKPPLTFGLPAEIESILAKDANKRSMAEQRTLANQFRQEDKHYGELQAALNNEKQAMPADAHEKEIEAKLAAANQPLPIDPKLQRMRRAVELSEEQLRNRRLTVAQDIVWALINNPSFLYNH